MNKSKYLLKNVGILTISNFSSKILVFLLVPLYTNILTTEEYGSYDLSVSMATLFYPILTLNIVDAVMRFTMDQDCDRKHIASIGFKYISVSVILFGIGMYVLNVANLWPDINGLEIYIFLYYVVYTLNQFVIQFAKGLEKVAEMGFAGVVSTVITILANVLFLLVFKLGLVGFFFANILSQLMSLLYLGVNIRIWRYMELRVKDKQLQKEMIRYSMPLIATAVGWWINSTSDKFVVAMMIGVSANGLLSVSYKIPQIINILQGIFIQAWQISAVKEHGDKNAAQFYGDTFTTINLLMCMACSWLIVLTRPLAHLLYAKDFYQAWKFVPFLLLSSVLNSAAGMLGPILSAKKDSKSMMWSAILGAGTNLVLNIVLVYGAGIQGVTIATVISSYIIYAIRKRAVAENIKIERYNIALLTWAFLFAQCVAETYFQSYVMQMVLMLTMLLINWCEIKDMLVRLWVIISRKKY